MADDETNQNEYPNSGCYRSNSDTGESENTKAQNHGGCSKWNQLIDDADDENDDSFQDSFTLEEQSRSKKIKLEQNDTIQTSINHHQQTKFERFDKPIQTEEPFRCETVETVKIKKLVPTVERTASKWSEFVDSEEDGEDD